eukprot:1669017-Amphidinium_carterae.1
MQRLCFGLSCQGSWADEEASTHASMRVSRRMLSNAACEHLQVLDSSIPERTVVAREVFASALRCPRLLEAEVLCASRKFSA